MTTRSFGAWSGVRSMTSRNCWRAPSWRWSSSVWRRCSAVLVVFCRRPKSRKGRARSNSTVRRMSAMVWLHGRSAGAWSSSPGSWSAWWRCWSVWMVRKRNGWSRDDAMVRSFGFSGSRFRCRWRHGCGWCRCRWWCRWCGVSCRYIVVEKLLTLFLGALGVQDHLLLSLDKTNRFSKLLCSGTQRCKFWRDGWRRCCRWCRWCNRKWSFWSGTAWFVRFLVRAKLWGGLNCRWLRSVRRNRRCFSQWWRVKGARWVRRAL